MAAVRLLHNASLLGAWPHSGLLGRRALSSVVAYEPVIGIEVHAQLNASKKLFSGIVTLESVGIVFPTRCTYAGAHHLRCMVAPAAAAVSAVPAPNARVAPLDMALPGTLPVLNADCVYQALRVGLALGGEPAVRASFDRKHYFYTDLPQGYQITQHAGKVARRARLQPNDVRSLTRRTPLS